MLLELLTILTVDCVWAQLLWMFLQVRGSFMWTTIDKMKLQTVWLWTIFCLTSKSPIVNGFAVEIKSIGSNTVISLKMRSRRNIENGVWRTTKKYNRALDTYHDEMQLRSQLAKKRARERGNSQDLGWNRKRGVSDWGKRAASKSRVSLGI